MTIQEEVRDKASVKMRMKERVMKETPLMIGTASPTLNSQNTTLMRKKQSSDLQLQ